MFLKKFMVRPGKNKEHGKDKKRSEDTGEMKSSLLRKEFSRSMLKARKEEEQRTREKRSENSKEVVLLCQNKH
jgi:hypothetical protein